MRDRDETVSVSITLKRADLEQFEALAQRYAEEKQILMTRATFISACALRGRAAFQAELDQSRES